MTRQWQILDSVTIPHEGLFPPERFSPLMAKLLFNRGFRQSGKVVEFILAGRGVGSFHEPCLMPGLKEALAILTAHINSRKPIWIYGDYDVDGVSGTALLYHCLRDLTAGQVPLFTVVPHRHRHGYGLASSILQEIAQKTPGALVITVDCGITAQDQAAYCRARLPLTLIITDHHATQASAPVAHAVVHPQLPGHDSYPFPQLCGAGVAFKLAQALYLLHGRSPEPVCYALATLGTVADVVSLTDENRLLVACGLTVLSSDIVSRYPGLEALLLVSGLANKRLQASDIAFGLGPRINAMGRLDDANHSVSLLTTSDFQEAMAIANTMDGHNQARKLLQQRIHREARAMVLPDQPAIVLHKADWDAGVVGIVAGKLAEETGKPVLLATGSGEKVSGSARGVAGFSVHEALSECAPHLSGHGGHDAAAGFALPSDGWMNFHDQFQDNARKLLSDKKTPVLLIESVVRVSELDPQMVTDLDQLEPTGAGNPAPVLAIMGVTLQQVRLIGKDQSHLSFQVVQDNRRLRAVAFGMGNRFAELAPGCLFDIAGTVGFNEFGGKKNVQIQVKDIQPSMFI